MAESKTSTSKSSTATAQRNGSSKASSGIMAGAQDAADVMKATYDRAAERFPEVASTAQTAARDTQRALGWIDRARSQRLAATNATELEVLAWRIAVSLGDRDLERAAAKRPAKKKSGAKRKPNAAFMKPMTPSSTLAAVVGSSPMPRTEVTSKLWGYIKRNNLQDKTNRRMINADDKLRDVFGGKRQVSMFEMTKLVAKHLK